jgi:hypothetical protein
LSTTAVAGVVFAENGGLFGATLASETKVARVSLPTNTDQEPTELL